ncbi:MAG: endonuclease/exonuclease/phosphatase family protein [Pseudomonadota bacterium]
MPAPLALVLCALLSAHDAWAEPAPPPVELRVATYNIWGLPGWLTHPTWRHRRGRVNRFLERGGYDVLAVQEAWSTAVDDLDPAPDLTVEAEDAGLGLWFRGRVGQHGQAIVRHFHRRRGVERLKHKGLLGAELTLVGGARVWVWTTHLQADADAGSAEVRVDQVTELLAAVDAHPGAAILLGDLNLHRAFAPDQPAAAALREAGFRDVALELDLAGEGTWADTDLRLDRVLLRDGPQVCLQPVDYRVERELGAEGVVSDHHPVWARVRVAPCAL